MEQTSTQRGIERPPSAQNKERSWVPFIPLIVAILPLVGVFGTLSVQAVTTDRVRKDALRTKQLELIERLTHSGMKMFYLKGLKTAFQMQANDAILNAPHILKSRPFKWSEIQAIEDSLAVAYPVYYQGVLEAERYSPEFKSIMTLANVYYDSDKIQGLLNDLSVSTSNEHILEMINEVSKNPPIGPEPKEYVVIGRLDSEWRMRLFEVTAAMAEQALGRQQ